MTKMYDQPLAATLWYLRLRRPAPPARRGSVPKRGRGGREDLRHFLALAELGRALGSAPDLRSGLERALEKLEASQGILRGAVFLFHEDSGELQVDAAVGIPSEGLRARYQPGEGIVRRVAQSRPPAIVPATPRQPLPMHRALQRRRTGTPHPRLIAVPSAP